MKSSAIKKKNDDSIETPFGMFHYRDSVIKMNIGANEIENRKF